MFLFYIYFLIYANLSFQEEEVQGALIEPFWSEFIKVMINGRRKVTRIHLMMINKFLVIVNMRKLKKNIDVYNFKILNTVSLIFETNLSFDVNSSGTYSSLDVSESGSAEVDFHPELFGLLDNPGAVRFRCVDYP